MFEQYQPLVERLYARYSASRLHELLAEAKQKIKRRHKEPRRLRSFRTKVSSLFSVLTRHCLKNKPLIKYLSEEGIKAGLLKTEEYYMANNNREMPKATEPLYFVVDEKLNSADLTDKGTDWLAEAGKRQGTRSVLPDITTQLSELEARTDLLRPGASRQERRVLASLWCTERASTHLAAAVESLHHV